MKERFIASRREVRRLTEQVQKQQKQLETLQVSFMHIGNVTMVTVVV
jgi:hypothetical protein